MRAKTISAFNMDYHQGTLAEALQSWSNNAPGALFDHDCRASEISLIFIEIFPFFISERRANR